MHPPDVIRPAPAELPESLAAAAVAVLTTPLPEGKVARTQTFAAAWRRGALAQIGTAWPPDRPARPERPVLLPPRDMPKRRPGSRSTRNALLHAVAHIELNAIDLAWDIIARFARQAEGATPPGDPPLPRAFFDDWVDVAADEAHHFELVTRRLADHGMAYGDLPAHDGLWQASMTTAGDVAARLAVVPLVLEARGLDVAPGISASLRAAGDEAGARIIAKIHDDEIRHVAAGKRWFDHVCTARGLDPLTHWQSLVRQHFKAPLKPPFNAASRDQAGFNAAFYEPLAHTDERCRASGAPASSGGSALQGEGDRDDAVHDDHVPEREGGGRHSPGPGVRRRDDEVQ
jgi:uncharacterized ferritin-like protein (DUF455 family)